MTATMMMMMMSGGERRTLVESGLTHTHTDRHIHLLNG